MINKKCSNNKHANQKYAAHRKNSLNKYFPKRSTLAGVVLMLVATVAAVAIVATISRRAKAAAGVEAASRGGARPANPTTPAQTPGLVEQRQVIRVFVHGDDIYPDVAWAKAGKIAIRAENEMLKDVALVVERFIPGKAPLGVARVGTQSRGKRAEQELTLEAGEYAYYEESRPEIHGKLIVEAK